MWSTSWPGLPHCWQVWLSLALMRLVIQGLIGGDLRDERAIAYPLPAGFLPFRSPGHIPNTFLKYLAAKPLAWRSVMYLLRWVTSVV